MAGEFWFYITTILICVGFALLMHTYPHWKIYLSAGFAAFVIGGGLLIYFDVNQREDDRIKMGQLERILDDAKKEVKKQESLTKDASDTSRLLAEQLKKKTEEIHNALKDKPEIGGKISGVRIFPWQRASQSETRAVDVSAAGILIFGRIENHGAGTPLAHWDLTILLPDNTVLKPQKWPVHKTMRIPCQDGPIQISEDQYLDPKNSEALQKTEARSGVILWMLKGVPLDRIRTKDSSYTLTVRDNIGVAHALDRYTLASLPQKCFGFDLSD
jgi:hypothetical protein